MSDYSFLKWPFFEDEHRTLVVELEKWAKSELIEYSSPTNVDAAGSELVVKLAEAGWLEYCVTKGYGGKYSSLDVRSLCLIRETLSRFSGLADFVFAMQGLGSGTISLFGSDDLKENYLPDVRNGKKIAAFALTETEAGSDAAALSTTAKKDGDHYILNGTKAFISGATLSDIYLTMVRTGDKSANGISCIIVDKNSEGLSFGKLENKMGWNSQPTAQVIFDNCKVPIKNLVGKEGDGFKIAMQGLDGGRINIASCSLGAAKACLEKSLIYVNDRTQFGKKISDFQATQFKLADMATQLEAARLMVLKAASELDNLGQETTKSCAMAKRFATDIGFAICNEALQLHGGYGYLSEYQIERYVRDLRVHQILEGTNEVMRVIISRALLNNR